MTGLLRRQPGLIAGLCLTVAVAVLVVAGPWLWPHDAFDRTADVLAAPGPRHWLGTDEEGYDILARVLAGGRLALLVGPGVAALSVGIGVVLGSLAGYFGGWLDRLVGWAADVLLAFPGILFALLVLFLTERPGLGTVVLSLSVTGWAGHARLVRMLVASARERDFVLGARCMGASPLRILVRYVLPEVAGPVAVQATFAVAAGILGEASLSFLGLGPQGVVSWGGLLEQGAVLFVRAPALVLGAGGGLLLLLTGLNLIGDGLRDLLDPRHGQNERSFTALPASR